MTIEFGPVNDESAHDSEAVSLASTDYTPTNAAGKAGLCRGLSFSAMTSLVLVTAAGTTVTFSTGELLAGIVHPIKFSKIVRSGSTVTNLRAYT